jgi:serine/threonine protein kinase
LRTLCASLALTCAHLPPLSHFLARYLVGRTIGEGTYGNVKYAQHSETGTAYALKVLNKDYLVQRGMVEQVKTEIAILKQIKHPFIVNMHEIMSSRDKIFLVMELVTGGDLFDKIAVQGPLKEDEGRDLFGQILTAIAHCHDSGVCHRDIKPENVLMTSDGIAKLSDFGLGAMREEGQDLSAMTTVCGTPNYAAPEVINKVPYNGYAADIWSLGVVLYVILAGCLPFDEENLVQLFEKVTAGEFTMPMWLSDESQEILQSMLQVDPSKRPTAKELLGHAWMCGSVDLTSGMAFERFPSAGVPGETMLTENSVMAKASTSLQDLKKYASHMSDRSVSSSDREIEAGGVSFNAFQLISDFFDISAIFEEKDDLVRRHTQFTTVADSSRVFDEIEHAVIALASGRAVKRTENILRLYTKSLKGVIHVTVSMIYLSCGSSIVDVQKVSGNTTEFYKWYAELVSLLPMDIIGEVEAGGRGPVGMNAFELINRNLSFNAIFETEEETASGHVQFSTQHEIDDVLLRIKQGVMSLGGFVETCDLERGRLDLILPTTSRRGMAVTVRHIEVMSGTHVVQLTKRTGTMIDLSKFYNKLTAGYLGEVMMRGDDGRRVAHPRANKMRSFQVQGTLSF